MAHCLWEHLGFLSQAYLVSLTISHICTSQSLLLLLTSSYQFSCARVYMVFFLLSQQVWLIRKSYMHLYQVKLYILPPLPSLLLQGKQPPFLLWLQELHLCIGIYHKLMNDAWLCSFYSFPDARCLPLVQLKQSRFCLNMSRLSVVLVTTVHSTDL